MKLLRSSRQAYRHLSFIVLAGILACASCRSALQSVPVITDPSGATARAGDQLITTPGSLVVPAGAEEMEIRIEMAGYETAIVNLTKPESSRSRDCWNETTSDSPKASPGGIQEPEPLRRLSVRRRIKAASDCSSEADLLEPGFVIRKLVPVAPKNEPPAR